MGGALARHSELAFELADASCVFLHGMAQRPELRFAPSALCCGRIFACSRGLSTDALLQPPCAESEEEDDANDDGDQHPAEEPTRQRRRVRLGACELRSEARALELELRSKRMLLAPEAGIDIEQPRAFGRCSFLALTLRCFGFRLPLALGGHFALALLSFCACAFGGFLPRPLRSRLSNEPLILDCLQSPEGRTDGILSPFRRRSGHRPGIGVGGIGHRSFLPPFLQGAILA
jgi:hypothetical protein